MDGQVPPEIGGRRSPEEGLRTTGGTETVLVVEDKAEIRDLVQEMLSSNGDTVLTAADGEEADHQPLKLQRRRIYVVDRSFQYGFMLRFAGMVVGGIALSFLVMAVCYYVCFSRSELSVTYFYITGEEDFVLKKTGLLALVLPSLGISALLRLGFTLLFALLYSHRIAGPLFNLKRVIREIREERLPETVQFRKADEFQDLAVEMNKTVSWLRRIIKWAPTRWNRNGNGNGDENKKTQYRKQ